MRLEIERGVGNRQNAASGLLDSEARIQEDIAADRVGIARVLRVDQQRSRRISGHRINDAPKGLAAGGARELQSAALSLILVAGVAKVAAQPNRGAVDCAAAVDAMKKRSPTA